MLLQQQGITYLIVLKKILLLITLCIVFKPVFPVFKYVAFYDYIVKELCVNKNKPELQCNGKCYLIKELSKTSESEKTNRDSKKTEIYELNILFCQNIDCIYLCFFTVKEKLNTTYKNSYTFLSTKFHFRPPDCF